MGGLRLWDGVYAVHGLTALFALILGVAAFFARKHPTLHRATGQGYLRLMIISLVATLPLLVRRPDDVLVATVALLLVLLNVGMRGGARLHSPDGQRAVAVTTTALASIFPTMAVVRAMTTEDVPWSWLVLGVVMYAINGRNELLTRASGGMVTTRVHGLVMLCTLVLVFESISVSAFPEALLQRVSEETIRATAFVLGLAAAGKHLWDTRPRSAPGKAPEAPDPFDLAKPSEHGP